MTQVSVAFQVSLVNRDPQDSQDLQANQESVVLAQVVPEPQVFLEPQGQKERRAALDHRPMALKDSQAPLDSLDLLALLDLRVPRVLLKVQPLVSLDSLEPLAPEESRVTQDSKASEVTLGTAAVSEEAHQGCVGYLELQEPMATPGSLDERVSLVTVVHLA